MRPADVTRNDGGWGRSARSLHSVTPVGVRASEIGGRTSSTEEGEKEIGPYLHRERRSTEDGEVCETLEVVAVCGTSTFGTTVSEVGGLTPSPQVKVEEIRRLTHRPVQLFLVGRCRPEGESYVIYDSNTFTPRT